MDRDQVRAAVGLAQASGEFAAEGNVLRHGPGVHRPDKVGRGPVALGDPPCPCPGVVDVEQPLHPDRVVDANHDHQVFVGTAQINRPVHVYDQERKGWYAWSDNRWVEQRPLIVDKTFVGTGTRNLTDDGREALADLFERSFGSE